MTSLRMLIRLPALFAVIAALAFVTSASAQGFKWWQADHVIKELALTPEQTRRLEEVWQKALPTLKAHKTTLDTAEAKFAKLIERGDEAAMEQIDVVEAARSELNRSRSRMLWNMRQVLTRDQWAKFTALERAAQERARAQAGAAGAAAPAPQPPQKP